MIVNSEFAAFTEGLVVADHGWAEIVERLESFRGLENDWDGEGSEAPETAVVAAAIRLARILEQKQVPPAERAVVSVNGSIYFEWRAPNKFCELEVVSPTNAEVRIVRGGRTFSDAIDIPAY